MKKYLKRLSSALLAVLFISCSALILTYCAYSSGVPETPKDVAAYSVSYSSIKVKWSAVSGATGYVVYHYNASTRTSTRLAVTKTTSYTNTGLLTGKTYYYKTIAYTTTGGKNIYGKPSGAVYAKVIPAVPGAFKAVSAANSSIKISWGAVNGSTGYVLYRYDSTAKAYVRLKVTTLTGFTHTGLTVGDTYSYKVRAYRKVGTENVYGNPTAPVSLKLSIPATAVAIVADHNAAAAFNSIPQSYIQAAKSKLHIAYGHTSHGSQLITGMDALAKSSSLYRGLDLRDCAFSSYGADDLGNPDRTTWASATRKYLKDYPATNVVIWSWCGQVDGTSEDITTYLGNMSKLEKDYPSVKFVYMTGHLNGSGASGNVNLRNQQIRDYCKTYKKTLYDFADIESYDPDGTVNYMKLYANDGCYYTSSGVEKNWAARWIAAHPADPLTALAKSSDECMHTEKLNGVLKGQAAWWLWAKLAGWGI